MIKTTSNYKSVLCLLTGCLFLGGSPAPAQNSSSTTGAASSIDDLLDRATTKVFSKFKGKVPADLKDKVMKEINRQVGKQGDSSALIDKVNAQLPEAIKNRLPDQVLSKLAGVKMNRMEGFSYWPGLTDQAHLMSLYKPAQGSNFPLIIYVHGGGWTSRPSAKSQPSWLGQAVKRGYAVCLVNYRLAQESPFPAQMEDLNTALRFIKANASRFDIDAGRIGLWGTSAGGHLVALMGTSARVSTLDMGANDRSFSRDVKAVCDFCGPADLYALATDTSPGRTWDTSSPVASLSIFLSGPAAQNKARADMASPVTYVSGLCPPILIMHGKADTIVPFSQSEKFAHALQARNAPVEFVALDGQSHDIEKGGNIDTALNFFDRRLKN